MFKLLSSSPRRWGRALAGLALLAGPLAALAQPTGYCIPMGLCARADIYEVSITNTPL